MGKYSEAAKNATKMTDEALGEPPAIITITQEDLNQLLISESEKKDIRDMIDELNKTSSSIEKKKIILDNVKNLSEASISLVKKIAKL